MLLRKEGFVTEQYLWKQELPDNFMVKDSTSDLTL
jgi:hypothetical protein